MPMTKQDQIDELNRQLVNARSDYEIDQIKKKLQILSSS